MSRAGIPWRWVASSTTPDRVELRDGNNRDRAWAWTYPDGSAAWHTFDVDGVGGENSTTDSLDDAKRHAVASLVVQGWAPGGWKVSW